MICWCDDPINRNTLSFWWTSSKCIRSLNCSTFSAGYFPLIRTKRKKRERKFLKLRRWETICKNVNLKIYPNGLFLAMFNVFKSSIFNVLIRAHCDHWDRSSPFDAPLYSRCNVCLCKITNCPHFVISKSNRMFWHDCSTHFGERQKGEKKRKIFFFLVWMDWFEHEKMKN